MNSIELGKRIKEARLAKKMTQSELVGDFITRNMLSRIESGNAYPSVKTLEYLANRLELPAGILMSDDPDDKDDSPSDSLIKLKDLFMSEKYEEASTVAELLFYSDFSDEAYAIYSKCQLALATKKMTNNQFYDATTYAKAARDSSQKGIYSSYETQTEAMLILNQIAHNSTK